MSGWQGIAQHSRHMKVLPKPWRFRRRGILTKGTLKVRKVLVFVGAVVVVSCALFQPATAEAATACTVRGTEKAEVLRGTAGADVICALGGNDVIYAGGGNDRIDGGPGNDKVYGGDGNDSLQGALGNDQLFGGTGTDSVLGGDGTDVLLGDSGNDALNGGPGGDTVNYSQATQAMTVNLTGGSAKGEGTDTLAGLENVTGSSYSDRLTGNSSANVLSGGDGADQVVGGGGNDRLNGNAGNDIVKGEAGNDDLTGGLGADNLDGGTGANPCHTDLSDTASLDSCEDVTPPQIVEFSFTPQKINTTGGPQVIEYRVRVRDDLAGIVDEYGESHGSFEVNFSSPSTSQYLRFYGSPWDESASGTRNDMTFVGKVTVPRYAQQGTWKIDWTYARDVVGNTNDWAIWNEGPPIPLPAGAPTSFVNGR